MPTIAPLKIPLRRRFSIFKRFSISLLALCINHANSAQESSAPTEAVHKDASVNRLEQVTVIGREVTEKADLGGVVLVDLPLSVFIVSRQEIERIRFVDPDDFLDRIPGETQVRNLRIPNGAKPYTLPMVDGMPLGDPYNGSTTAISGVNSSDIERIEVIKGPASALYSNNAFGGVINVVSRDLPETNEHRVWVEAGDFGHVRGGINSGGALTDTLWCDSYLRKKHL